MSAADKPRYFDYLEKYGVKLQSIYKYIDLVNEVAFWRKHGIEIPSSAAGFCRKALEGAVDHLLRNSIVPRRANLEEKIQQVHDEGFVDRSFYYKYDQIRKTGNSGTHKSVQLVEAKMCMELLDEVLYDLLFRLGFAKPPKKNRDVEEESMFYAYDPKEARDLERRAKTAATLSKDPTVEKKASDVVERAEKTQATVDDVLAKIEEIVLNLGAGRPNEEEIHEKCDMLLGAIQRDVDASVEEIREARAEVEEIISEHDFIKKLLVGRGGGEANDEQLDVMAFPKTSQASSTMLLLRGGAGTGKTLCLLAKLIKQIEVKEEDVESGKADKRALFVCFNKSLSNHIDDLLRSYPQARERIDVVSYDMMINHLVKPVPDDDVFGKYASDVRYGRRWKILYELPSDKVPYRFVKQAMERVAGRYPQKMGNYYLSFESDKDAAWVKGELDWIEAKFDSLEQAKVGYPKVARTGRTAARRPNAEARKIILEVLESYHDVLAKDRYYTIEQAMKRLMASNDLPQYDAIAIDEVQDLSLLAIKTLLKMRRCSDSWVYISGDEDQRIYQRDFTWKELGEDAHGYTITLHENKRNVAAIEAFASRLTGKYLPLPDSMDSVTVKRLTEAEISDIVADLRRDYPSDSIAYIGYSRSRKIDPTLCVSPWQAKGLEYDTVIVDCSSPVGDDLEAEMRFRYVHFTRARKRLYVVYRKNPPEILTSYYADFL